MTKADQLFVALLYLPLHSNRPEIVLLQRQPHFRIPTRPHDGHGDNRSIERCFHQAWCKRAFIQHIHVSIRQWERFHHAETSELSPSNASNKEWTCCRPTDTDAISSTWPDHFQTCVAHVFRTRVAMARERWGAGMRLNTAHPFEQTPLCE